MRKKEQKFFWQFNLENQTKNYSNFESKYERTKWLCHKQGIWVRDWGIGGDRTEIRMSEPQYLRLGTKKKVVWIYCRQLGSCETERVDSSHGRKKVWIFPRKLAVNFRKSHKLLEYFLKWSFWRLKIRFFPNFSPSLRLKHALSFLFDIKFWNLWVLKIVILFPILRKVNPSVFIWEKNSLQKDFAKYQEWKVENEIFPIPNFALPYSAPMECG